MNIIHVFILFAVLWNATAQSGSDAGSGGESGGESHSGRGSGSDGVEEFNTNDIIRVIEEEVKREQFENGESVSSQTAEKMDDSSASGSGINHEPNVSHVDNEHPTHPLTKPIYLSRQTSLNSKQTSHQRQEISSPTVTPLQKPDKPLDTSLSKDAEKNTSNKSNHLTTHPRINPSVPTVPPSQMNIFRENSRSKYRHSYSENGFGTEEQDDANQGSRVEYAHLNKVVDEMKKLKKSKTDEELGEKIRSGTESLGVSFKTFEQLSGLWISVLHRIWRVWKAKGAKQVMSSIANNLVTKTTQTVTPHIGHIIQRGLKFGSENPSKKIIVSFDKNNNEIYTKPTKQVSNTSLTRKSTAEDSKKKKVVISLLPKEHITTKRFSTVLKTDHNNPSTKSTQAEEQVVKTLFEVSKKTKAKTFGKTMIKVKVQPVYNKKGYKSPGKPGDNKRYLHFNGKQHNVENLGDFDGNVPVNTKLENAMQHRNVSEELRVNSKKKNLEKQGDFGRNKLKYENESMKQRNVANDVHEDSKQRYNIKQGTVDENVHVEPNMAAKQGVVPKHKQYKKQEHKNYEKLHDNERYMQVDGNQTNGEKQGNVEKDAYVDGKRKNSIKTGNVAAVNLPVDSKHTKTKMQGGFGKNVHKFGNAEDSVKHKGISRDHHLDRKPGNANTVEGDVERKVHVDNKYGIIKNMTRQHQKASKKDTHSNLVGVKVFDKNEYKPRNHDTKMTSHKTKGRIEKQIGLSSKPRQTESVKKGLVAELITSPTPLRSMLMTSEDDNTYQLKNSVQGPKSLTAESSSKHKVDILQNKVHHLENEVTVLQTAVAGLAQRLNYVENSVQEVSNVTQSEVIIGPTQMSTTPLPSSSPAPTQTPTSTQQPTSTFHPSTEQLSIQEQFLDNVLPTHQPSKSTFHFINKPSPSSEQFNQIAELPEQKPSTSTFHRVIKQSLLPEQFKELEEEQQQQQQQQRQRQRQRQQQMQQQQQQQLLRPITKPSILPEQFQITDLPASANEPRQPIITTHSEDNRHNLHQVIIPLETLYRMQTQEGIQVPDDNNYNSHERNVLTENQLSLPQGGDLTAPNNDGPVASPMDASVENINQRKVQIPLDQNQQSVAMNTLPGDGTTDSVVRPVVNIIVPNSQTASILEKEMCRVPCRNGGKCNGLNTCECTAFFHGPHCEQFALYDFIKNKAKQWPESSTKRNSLISNVRKPVKGRRISLSDLIQLGSTGTHFRLSNGHLFSLAEERGKTFLPHRLTKTRKAVKRKQYIVEI